MGILNISRKAQQILQRRGITELKEVLDFPPNILRDLGVSINDLSSLRSQLKERFGRKATRMGWSKTAIRRLNPQERGNTIIPPGTKVDGSVLQRFFSRTRGRQHGVKKPRNKGLL